MHSLRALNILMVISRTFDTEIIKRIFTDPDNYNFLTDDGSAEVEEYEPLIHESLYYLLLGEDDGIVLLQPTNSISLDAHICMSTKCRGKKAIAYGIEAVKWVFKNTGCHKINTRIPFYNRKVLHYAVAVGFEHEGIDEQGFMKDGYLYDQYILGIKRVTLCHH